VEIEPNKLTVCVGPSGSGKSSFAFDTLIKKEKCEIKNYPKSVKSISQRISRTGEKLDSILTLSNIENSLIIIDEPLAGTTHEEATHFSKIIKKLANKNAVVVVEHRSEIFSFADVILVFGPQSGPDGGELIDKLTGVEYLNTLPKTEIKREKNISNKKISAHYREFNGIDDYKVELVLNTITSITGPSGCGKSTYLDAIYKALDKSVGASERRKNLIEVKNKNYIRRPHIIDASPVTKNSKSTVATYYGISKFFKDKDMNITVKEALIIYAHDNLITRRLIHLNNIGLDYLKLNQPSFTLSGGECQRIKLAKLLCKKLGDRSVYIFDNPVRGLGATNISNVMMMFDNLVKNNNTVLIAENDPNSLEFVDNIIKL
ncbi:MAG: ATP-binding cassette domain-containing protein, partial [Bacilli bacterium]|nr:ATP-binding cassette domain-containing protein [Bacilli bacterium]